ncbi:hypothetical protein C2E23DRAFT_599578 [Lenzites betulinus]|nr:hypothetical protein C2E23DRAFT_599578 [Lenzites betulinus]
MTGTLALMLQVPPTGLPCDPAAPKPNTRPRIAAKARPTGPRRPRTQTELNDVHLRRVSAAVACPPSKHSLQTPGILPKPRRHSARLSSPSSTSAHACIDTLTLVSSTPSSLTMSSSTTTMTLSPHARLRVSESTPPFLIQQKHGPPPYFLYRTPVAAPHRGPSTPPLKQKRSFNIGSSNALEQSSTAPQAQLVDADTIYAPATIYTPETTPGGAEAPAPAKSRYRLSPPSPEKALPPIPFPSRSSSPVVDATGPARSLLLPTLPCVKAPRPTSQDKEETIRQLEQLAAELKRMGLGVLLEASHIGLC